MFENIEPEYVKNEGLDQKPTYYQSMGGNALQDRLGSKTTYTGFLKIVGQQDFTIYVPADTTVTTISAHGVKSSIPFIFLYLKTNGYWTRVGFRTGSHDNPLAIASGIGNAVIDEKNFSFSVHSFIDPVSLNMRAIIFEVGS